jgi:transglutaminase-like putative cysteine protease
MARLKVVHRTRYRYETPVRESFNEVRLRPVSNEHQRCEDFMLKVLPAAHLRHYDDFHANRVHHFEVIPPHDSLLIEATSRVETNLANWLAPDATPFPMSRIGECGRMERCFDYLQPSDYVGLDPDLWRLAVDVAGDETDAWQAARRLSGWIHSSFTYAPRATTAYTRMSDALQRRAGVCQDYAHVLVGLCRSLRIPALYVSGYYFTPGADASHAWAEVYVPGHGWRGLDPTHATQPDDRYIKVAVGRDYGDVAPTRGHYKGTQQRSIEVAVEIAPAEA